MKRSRSTDEGGGMLSTLRRTLSLNASTIASAAEARVRSSSGKVVGWGNGIEKEDEGRVVLTGEIEVCREGKIQNERDV